MIQSEIGHFPGFYDAHDMTHVMDFPPVFVDSIDVIHMPSLCHAAVLRENVVFTF